MISSNEVVDSPSSSQPEVVKHDATVEASQGHHYPFPSVSGYSFENNAQTNSQIQNLAPFSSVMVLYYLLHYLPWMCSVFCDLDCMLAGLCQIISLMFGQLHSDVAFITCMSLML